MPTRAGSKINREREPAARDAALVRRLEAAGAILVGALNMGEYAYDFTGENAHDGPSRNPHDPRPHDRRLVRRLGRRRSRPGSCRSRSAPTPTARSGCRPRFCGVFGLKPTFGRLSRAGSFPFVASLDHLGPLARSVADLALAYDAMQGPDPDDPARRDRPPEPRRRRVESRHRRPADRRRRRSFRATATSRTPSRPSQLAAEALGATRRVEIPEAARARAAAYVITAAEGAALHLDRLRERAPPTSTPPCATG